MNASRRWAVSTVVLVAMCAGLWAVLRGPALELRREVLTERAVEALRDGLAQHHQEHGRYVAEPFLSGGELARCLVEAGYLEALPLNPTTGEPIGSVDLERDPLFYESFENGARYTLEVLQGATSD